MRKFEPRVGVTDHDFFLDEQGVTIQIIDVGGQKSERKKWMHHFEDIHLVIYFSALDGYSLKPEDNDKTFGNRLLDDLALFNSLLPLLKGQRSWMFFQNKEDLFEETLKKFPLDSQYPTIPKTKGSNKAFCLQFLRELFLEKWPGNPDDLLFTSTCALDPSCMEKIWKKLRSDYVHQMIESQRYL